jgi:hypothetical protein
MLKNIINKFLKGNQKMVENKQTTASLTETFANHDFQWVKGDNFMEIESFESVVDNGGEFFINFKSGRRINHALLEEYLTWFPSPQKKEVVNAPQTVQQKQTEITSVKFMDSKNQVSGSSDSPIYNLLARQKKKDVEIGINIKVPLPSKDLFNVLVSSFDDAENEIIQFIIDSIDLEEIRKTLSRSIRENYYGISDETGSFGQDSQRVKKENKSKDKKEEANG